jgi:archaellum component FlaF (FlaF/FlaG flagellin family)
MGLSVSAASAILAMGFALTALVLVDSFTHNYEKMDEASQDRTDRQRDILDTRIEIRNATFHNGSRTLGINITNTGSATLDPNSLDVLLDGVLHTHNITSREVDGAPASAWFPAKTLLVTMGAQELPSRVKVVTGNGVTEYSTDVAFVP